MEKKVSEYISGYLASRGITDCFMVTGGGAMHLDDALGHQEGIRCTFNHHEQACAIAAEAYTRMTGKLPVVCVTSGPGGLNTLTGIMGAWTDSIPMLVLSGQVKRETTLWSCPELELRQLGDQEVDIISVVQSLTKYSVMLTDPEEVAYHLEKALYLAENGRGGPVWIDVPLDVQGARIETDTLRHFDPETEDTPVPSIPDSVIAEVLAKLNAAKAPLILAGTGIRLGKAEELFLKAADLLKIPVVTAWNATDTLAFDSPWFAGMPGTVGTRPGNFAVQNCDLLLSLGCRMNIRMVGYNRFDFAKNATMIAVDIDPKELKKPTLKVDLPVEGDVHEFLEKLIPAAENSELTDHSVWTKWCRDLTDRYPVVEPGYCHEGAPINPYVFIDKLFGKLSEDDRIICSNGSACVITFQAGKVKQGQRLFTNSGCAAMGYGLPAAVGVAISDNSRRTVCLEGDGSLMMNLQELATVMKNRLDIRLIILNNNGYHSIRQTQSNLFKGAYVGIDPTTGVAFPDFQKIAEAFGMPYYRLDSEESADPVLSAFLEGNGPAILEAVVDPAQNFQPKSSSKVLPDGRIVSPTLDDMAPFLPKDEYEANHFRGTL